MSILKKRKWKTLGLDEYDMADFAAIGGLEIDVLSDDSDLQRTFADPKKQLLEDDVKPKKKKKKSKSAKERPKSSEGYVLDPKLGSIETPSNTTLAEAEINMSAWSMFQLRDEILQGLRRLRFVTPSPIQNAVIDRAMEGLDILGAAQTGSGKTLAFGLPILHSILNSKAETCTRALCVLPTRELAMQVRDHLEEVVGTSAVTIGTAVGGMSVEKQFRVLSRKPDIVVGTPGRIAGLLGLGKTKEVSQICKEFRDHLCDKLSFFVLDEADRLLEKSHFRDLTEIFRFIYQSIPSVDALQSFIFSATLPVAGAELGVLMKRLRLKPSSKRCVVDLVRTETESAKPSLPTGLGFKTLYATEDEDREPLLVYYLLRKKLMRGASETHKVIVFVNAISYVYRLSSLLPECLPGVKVLGIHSNLRQKERLKKLDQFKAAPGFAVLVATDLAARGLDLPSVDAVVHLQPPRTPEALIHRSGRTARAGRQGECAMIITSSQAASWGKTIRQALDRDADDIDTIYLVSGDIGNVRAIHRLASKLEGQTHKQRKESNDKAWTQKTCQEAELWDSDASGGDNNSDAEIFIAGGPMTSTGPIQRTSDTQDRVELNELLKNPLPSLRS